MKKLSFVLTIVLFLSVFFSSFVMAEDVYIVKSGDVLWKIAENYGIGWQELSEYNNLANPNLIYPGQKIRIPDKEPMEPNDEEIITENNQSVEETKTLTILHTNDMHGFFIEGAYDGMGAAKLSAKVNELRENNDNVLLLDAGDATQGNNLVTLSKGETAITILNAMKYDAMAAGNHEFDYGKDRLLEFADLANFPILAANVQNEDGSDFLTNYIIKEMDGFKVGIFGLATPETTFKSHPKNSEGLTFVDPILVAKEMVAELQGKVDVIIALSHLGIEGDDTSVKLAENVTGIDLIVDGHSHSELPEGMQVNGTLIVQTSEKTKNLGIVELIIKDGGVISKTASLFTKAQATDITPDEGIQKIIDQVKVENEKITAEVVATSPIDLNGERDYVRTGETNLGNLITAAMLDVSGADIALMNGGGMRTSIEAGEVTKGDILTVLPFGNLVTVIEVTGADIKAAMENGIDSYPATKGAFPHIAGMTVTFDATKEAGNRVVEIMVGNELLDETKTYKLVTNDFLAAGGDGYAMFVGKKVVAEFSALDEVLINYILINGFDEAKTDGRIKEINADVSLDELTDAA